MCSRQTTLGAGSRASGPGPWREGAAQPRPQGVAPCSLSGTWGKLGLSEPLFPHLQNGEKEKGLAERVWWAQGLSSGRALGFGAVIIADEIRYQV